MSKSRFLDGPPSWDFNLGVIPGLWEIQMTNMTGTRTTATRWILCWCNFCKSHLLTLFTAPLWQLCHHFQPEHVEFRYFWNFWQVIFVIWISHQTRIPPRLKSQLGGPSKILNLLIRRPQHIKNLMLIMFLRKFCIWWAIKPTFGNSNHFWPFPRAPENYTIFQSNEG